MKTDWKDIKNYEGIYQINSEGIVRRISKNGVIRIKKTQIDNRTGYYTIGLCVNYKQKNYFIHRLLIETFIPNPLNQKIINHIDGIRTNNHLNNLEWCDFSHNNKEAYRIGNKLSNTPQQYKKYRQIKQIKNQEIIKVWDSINMAARELGLSKGAIWNTLNNPTKYKSCGECNWEYVV